jgi:hypothetical protein
LTGNIPPIDQMPALKAQLGKARSDRVRYAGQANPTPPIRGASVTNTVIEPMQCITPHKPSCRVSDVLTGVARLDSTRIPLSIARLFTMFQCVPELNTREIMKMTGLNNRQAQRYMRAVKIALPHLEQIFVHDINWFD